MGVCVACRNSVRATQNKFKPKIKFGIYQVFSFQNRDLCGPLCDLKEFCVGHTKSCMISSQFSILCWPQEIRVGRREFVKAAQEAARMPVWPDFTISLQISFQISGDCFPRHKNSYILAGRHQGKTSFNLAFILHIFPHLFYLPQVIKGNWSEGLKVFSSEQM